jgi:2-amino-4-hydroxy-6-hydroxymethyldihydropteridine diphosphokinase
VSSHWGTSHLRSVPDSEAITEAFVALGSNLGDRLAHLRAAIRAFETHPGILVARGSPVYRTRAHTLRPGEQQPDYLNAVAQLRTRLSVEDLLSVCQHIEQIEGRDRANASRWTPRTLDLDLLLYGRLTISTGRIIIPHPRMGERRFVLCPLNDIAPDLFIPTPYDKTVAELLASCPDPDRPEQTADNLG